jgi:hypothetical protein
MQLAHFETRMTQKREAAQNFLMQHLKGCKTGKKCVGME